MSAPLNLSSRVAQSVEHLIVNQAVPGSRPGSGACALRLSGDWPLCRPAVLSRAVREHRGANLGTERFR